MYHEQTYEHIKHRKMTRVIWAIIAAIACLTLFLTVSFAQASAKEQSAFTIRESVLNAAKQCCAVESAYPSSLKHLEEKYGLTINHNDYTVDYEWLADNIVPNVVVKPR